MEVEAAAVHARGRRVSEREGEGEGRPGSSWAAGLGLLGEKGAAGPCGL